MQNGSRRILEDFEAVRENLLALSNGIWLSIHRVRLFFDGRCDDAIGPSVGKTVIDTSHLPQGPCVHQYHFPRNSSDLELLRLGIVMSEEDATAAAELTDAWTRLTSSLKMLAVQVGAALAPKLRELADWVRANVRPTIEWIKRNKELIVKLAKLAAGLLAVGAALKVVGGLISTGGMIATGMSSLLALATPLGAAITAAATALGVLTYAYLRNARAAEQAYDKARQFQQQLLKGRPVELPTRAPEVVEEELSSVRRRLEHAREKAKWAGSVSERESAMKEIEFLRNKVTLLEEELERARATPSTPEPAPETGVASIAERGDFEQQMAERLHQLRIEQIEDEEKRELAAIKHKYDLLWKEAERLHAATADLAAAEQAEMDAAHKRARERREAEEKRAAEEQAARMADLDQQIARERIMATKKGLDQQMALLDIELAQQLKEAKTAAEQARLEELYELKRQNLLAGQQMDQLAQRITTVGTFSPMALWGLAGRGPMERTAAATEQTAKNTKRLVDQARDGLVFSN